MFVLKKGLIYNNIEYFIQIHQTLLLNCTRDARLSRSIIDLESNIVPAMVLILDGNSEMGAHVRRNLCYLMCLMHLIRLRADTILISFFRSPKSHFYSFMRASMSWVTI